MDGKKIDHYLSVCRKDFCVAYFGANKDGTEFFNAGYMCFAPLRSSLSSVGTEVLYNVIQEGFRHGYFNTLEQPERFLDYLMNRSVFKDCYLEKDAKAALEKGYTVHDCNAPAVLFMGALTAQRMLTENDTYTTKYFNYMVDQGIPEEFAILVGHHLLEDYKIGRTRNSNHSIFECYFDIKTAVNFLNKKIVGEIGLPFNTGSSTIGVHRLFVSDCVYEDGKQTASFYKFINKYSNKNLKKSKNPFDPNDVEINKFPIERIKEVWEDFQKEYMS